MSDSVYGLLRLIIFMSGLTLVLYLTATKFDSTELRTIITMFLVAAGSEGVIQLVRGKK